MSRLHDNRSRFKPAFLPLGWLAMLASIDLGALRSNVQCK